MFYALAAACTLAGESDIALGLVVVCGGPVDAALQSARRKELFESVRLCQAGKAVLLTTQFC